MRRRAAGLALGGLCVLAPVAPAAAAGPPAWNAVERAAILSLGPWPPAPAHDASNGVQRSAEAARFGRQLFFDARLSADGRFSCATCHVPARAFQDGLRVAAARGAGQRNTPTLLDVAQQRWFGWDGSNDSLWAASLAPLLAPAEMAHSPATLAASVRERPPLVAGYRQAFGRAVPAASESGDLELVVNLAKALAAFQATLASPRTPFDHFRDALQRGDARAMAAYPADAQRGLRLFVGTARCILCHGGARFSHGEFADAGVPHFVPGGVDSGRHGGVQRVKASALNRLGRFNDAGPAADPQAVLTEHLVAAHRNFGEFRVPGLRQLVHTAPFMHDGSLATIEDVVRHYSRLNEERLHADGERILRRLDLSARQEADLAAFLRSLSTPGPR